MNKGQLSYETKVYDTFLFIYLWVYIQSVDLECSNVKRHAATAMNTVSSAYIILAFSFQH